MAFPSLPEPLCDEAIVMLHKAHNTVCGEHSSSWYLTALQGCRRAPVRGNYPYPDPADRVMSSLPWVFH